VHRGATGQDTHQPGRADQREPDAGRAEDHRQALPAADLCAQEHRDREDGWPDDARARPAGGSSGSRNTGSQTSGGLLLSVAPAILGSLVDHLRGRGVEPAVVGQVLAGPAGRIGVRRLPPPR